MATIARELHDGLVTVLDKLNTVAAVLQRIDAEQQNCIHKLDVMAGIQLSAQPPPTPLLALASTNLV
jgi:nitrate/nitrite-specific signal transduction histidine kinase